MTSPDLAVPALAKDRQVVVASDRIEFFGSLYCLRTSTDGRVWTSDTIITTSQRDGTWVGSWSGGTTFGAPDLAHGWATAWLTGGDTVAGEYETDDGTRSTVMAVSGFAAPWVERILVTDAHGQRWLSPRSPWNAFVATALGTEARLIGEGHDGTMTDPIAFAVNFEPEP